MKALCILPDGFRLYADSSVHRNFQPVFLPDCEGGWTAAVCPYVRMSRLGMNISEKFAARYYDSVGGACLFMPSGGADNPLGLEERYFAMDSAFAAGNTVSPDSPAVIASSDRQIVIDTAALGVDRTIAGLSRFMTFKTGDLLIFPAISIKTSITEGDRVTASINGSPCLDIKIK